MADLKSILGDAYKEGMTVEEIEQALANIDLYAGYVKKEVFDKTASEVAKYKKELQSKMSEEELAKQKAAEEKAELEKRYNDLLRRTTISEHKAKLIGLGYDEKLAAETAEALVDGKMDVVFANQAKFKDSLEKSIKAQLTNNTPLPGASASGDGVDYKKLAEEAINNGKMAEAVHYLNLAAGQT